MLDRSFLIGEGTAEIVLSLEILLIGTSPLHLMALRRWVALGPQAVLSLQNNKSILLPRTITENAIVEYLKQRCERKYRTSVL